MMTSVKDKVRPIYYFILLIFKINWVKTVYINFKTQPFNIAFKFPIIVYGKLKIYTLLGNIKISSPISMGMIHLGKEIDFFPVSLNPIKLTINSGSCIIFEGPAIIMGGCSISVWNGEFKIGKYVTLGSGVQIKCEDKITIGSFTRVVAMSTITDTNFHFVKDIKTGIIKRSFAPISIGNNCWLNSGTIVTKGVVLPDYCITAQNTFLNKDYSKICQPNTFLAGSPAKVLASNVQRIFDNEEEKRLKDFFYKNPDLNEYQTDIGIHEEPSSTPDLFKLY